MDDDSENPKLLRTSTQKDKAFNDVKKLKNKGKNRNLKSGENLEGGEF